LPEALARHQPEPARQARDLVPAVDRAMNILALLGASPQRAYTVSEIARALGMPKSSAFNLCGALIEGQLLRRARDGFQLGRGLVQLGSAYVSSVNLVGEFYDLCRALPLDLQAIVQMAVLDEDFNAVYLAAQDCNSGLRLGLGGGVGRRMPANCTACGKALLALLPPAEFEARLAAAGELARMTRKSVSSAARLRREVAETRRTGYAVDDEETVAGLSCVAAAFASTHADGGSVAISVSARRDLLDDARKAALRDVLDRLMSELQTRL
jgi:DNA-binding IclR family transcriptional regulator